MKLVYLGTPQMAVPPLEAVVDAGHEIVLVVTGRDKRRGRGSATSPTPVKAAAERLGLTVTHEIDDVLATGAELGVVVAYGSIIRPHVLDVIPMVNLHFSLLPRWRGAAPVERALLTGDATTGVCVMAVEEGLDTGGIYSIVEVPIDDTITAAELRHELVQVGCDLLIDTLERGLGVPEPQVGTATYASKIDPSELRIDWTGSVDAIHRLVRLGGAWTTFRGARLKIRAAEVVEGELVPTIVQPEGKPRMEYSAWRNGAHPEAGESFE